MLGFDSVHDDQSVVARNRDGATAAGATGEFQSVFQSFLNPGNGRRGHVTIPEGSPPGVLCEHPMDAEYARCIPPGFASGLIAHEIRLSGQSNRDATDEAP